MGALPELARMHGLGLQEPQDAARARALMERQEAALARLERILDAVERHPLAMRFLGGR